MNDEIMDENITRIGFRTVEISATKGFLLNVQALKILRQYL